jgi:hypothetical protein
MRALARYPLAASACLHHKAKAHILFRSSRSTPGIPAPINPQLEQAAVQRLAISKVSSRQAVDPARNLGLRSCVAQLRQPTFEQIFPGGAQVMANFDHGRSVIYKLQ